MKYYLVALFDDESTNFIEGIQRNLCRKFKLNRNMPAFHITLDVVGDPDLGKLIEVVNDIIKPYKKFKVQINEAVCFNPPYKAANLRVEGKGYIMRLARCINDTLKLHGFDVKDNGDNMELYVNLLNSNLSGKDSSICELAASSENVKREQIMKMTKIDRIELWKQTNSRKEAVVKRFPLREF